MTSPIADGTYNIRNVQFSDYYINLSGGFPYAGLNAWPLRPSGNLRWIVKNVGNDKITLENVTAHGYYAAVDYFFKGAPAFASPNPSYWTVTKVSEGVYTLGVGGLLLDLHRGGELASVALGPLQDIYLGKQQQWTFERVGN